MDEFTLNDLLECSVCLERLDTSSKVLPCQHTFCKKCLDEIVSSHKELRCPECRVLVECKIEELPPNVLLMRILEGIRNNPRRRNDRSVGHFGSSNCNSSAAESLSPTHHHRPQITGEVPCQLTPQHIRQKSNELLTNHQRQRSGDQQLNDSSRSHAGQPACKTSGGVQPVARAIYDYAPKEVGDLSFKKGDIVILRKKIDSNWFYGELNGATGTFPMSYVQILTPLPCHIPQCKALYDFRMTNDDEEGCLKFTKGEVITVIRRVDENWAEGRLADKVGIFPLAFVEMNNVARTLMKLSTNSQPGPSRNAPPTPVTEDATPLISNNNSSPPVPPQSIVISNITPPSSVQPPTPAARQVPNSQSHTSPTSPSSSSTTTSLNSSSSNNTTCSSSSSSDSTPTSPPAAPTPSKRHSFSHLMHSQSNSQPSTPHRYSAEILSSSKEPESLPANLSVDTAATNSAEASSDSCELKRQGSLRSYKKSSSGGVCSGGSITTTSSSSSTPPSSGGSQKHSAHVSLKTPALYIAIYPYKPQKADELELRRGSVYTVIERCQDGWFKGTSNRTQKSGVFPGNYVAPSKSLPALQAQLRTLRSNAAHAAARNPSTTSPPSVEPRLSTPKSRPSKINGVISASTPPDLPPRSDSPKPSSTVWNSSSTSQSQSHGNVESSRNAQVLTSLVIPPPNVSMPNTPTRVSASSVEKKKEKNSHGGVSLMRRLTLITTKGKSPPPPCYSMDNPVFEDGGTVTTTVTPVTTSSSPSAPKHIHVRSDSCPSKLLMPVDPRLLTSPGNSQRSKHKDRPSAMNHFPARPVETVAETSSHHHNQQQHHHQHFHRKSNSLDASTCPAPASPADTTRKPKQLVPPIRERFRCIVPYPPNSEYELELRVGDIIYVHKKRDDGWYKGTQQRTGKTGLFPASFVESF